MIRLSAPTLTLSVITAKARVTKRQTAGLKRVAKKVKVHIKDKGRKLRQLL